jgi:hypothetical protein
MSKTVNLEVFLSRVKEKIFNDSLLCLIEHGIASDLISMPFHRPLQSGSKKDTSSVQLRFRVEANSSFVLLQVWVFRVSHLREPSSPSANTSR